MPKVVEVLARPIRDRVQDDVAVSRGLSTPLKSDANSVDPINDKARSDDREPVGVTINSV